MFQFCILRRFFFFLMTCLLMLLYLLNFQILTVCALYFILLFLDVCSINSFNVFCNILIFFPFHSDVAFFRNCLRTIELKLGIFFSLFSLIATSILSNFHIFIAFFLFDFLNLIANSIYFHIFIAFVLFIFLSLIFFRFIFFFASIFQFIISVFNFSPFLTFRFFIIIIITVF